MIVTAQQVEQYIEEQRAYFFSGETRDLAFRIAQLQTLKATIQKYEKEVVEALYADLHKSEFEAYSTEISIVYSSIDEFSKNLAEWAKPVAAKTPIAFQPAKSYIVREPYGVTCIIGPFNYPFQLVMEPLLGAIIGGNTAIIKPSETAIATAAIVKIIIEEAFESRYVRIVEGAKETVEALIHAPFDFIFFTGSVNVGKVIAKACAERLTPHVLELGGKSPAIVDHTANLHVAAQRIAFGRFANAGQTCVAPDYVLVQRSVHQKFVKLLQKAIRSFYGKEPKTSEFFGRIITKSQVERLANMLAQDRAHIVTGGEVDVTTQYVAPTIVDNVSWDAATMQEEIFGPILPIIVYDDLPTALHEAKRLPKPLAAYFFSEHNGAIEYFTQNFPFGGGCINDTIMHVGNTKLPFGGVGPSGSGTYHGYASFECFTHAKSMMKRSTKINPSILYPPYSSTEVAIVKTLL
ncbi:MAG: aldehyde dehydrogenase [Caryophanon sp.]|nr:aldehyde dehydrogenase [Caryophanon sp.]